MAEPWSADFSALERLESRFWRARAIIDGLDADSPKNLNVTQAQIHVYAKLGVVLQRRSQMDEAETCYRRAIAITTTLVERTPTNDRARVDRMDIREELAMLQFERGLRDEARSILNAAADDLRSLDTSMEKNSSIADRYAAMIADRYTILAADFQRFGETERGDELAREADEIRARSKSPGRDGGGRRPIEETP